jgi:hypothetical protein
LRSDVTLTRVGLGRAADYFCSAKMIESVAGLLQSLTKADFSAKNQRHPTQVFAKRQTASRRVVIATGNVTGEGVESEMRR